MWRHPPNKGGGNGLLCDSSFNKNCLLGGYRAVLGKLSFHFGPANIFFFIKETSSPNFWKDLLDIQLCFSRVQMETVVWGWTVQEAQVSTENHKEVISFLEVQKHSTASKWMFAVSRNSQFWQWHSCRVAKGTAVLKNWLFFIYFFCLFVLRNKSGRRQSSDCCQPAENPGLRRPGRSCKNGTHKDPRSTQMLTS